MTYTIFNQESHKHFRQCFVFCRYHTSLAGKVTTHSIFFGVRREKVSHSLVLSLSYTSLAISKKKKKKKENVSILWKGTVGQETGLHIWSKIHFCTACTLTWKDRHGEIISHSHFPTVLPFKTKGTCTNTESLSCAPETNIMLDVNYISIKRGKRKEGQISWKIVFVTTTFLNQKRKP